MNTAANSIQSRKLKYYCDITSSKRIYASDYVEDGIPFVRGKEVVQRYKNPGSLSSELFITRNKFETLRDKFGAPIEGDLLLTSVGTLGVPYYVKPEDEFYFKDGNLIWFRQFQELRSKFLYYWIQSPRGRAQLQKCTIGTSQSAYTIERLKEIELDDFALCKQERIASILSAYDDLIENNRRRIALLEQAARLLYKEWFVHLRFPGHEHTKIKNGVPEGWEKKKIANVCETVGGGTPSTKVAEYWDGDVIWVVPSDVTKNDCLVLLDSERKITEKGLRASSAKMVPAETILMTSRASVGFFALMDKAVCTNQGFINVIPYENDSRMYLLFHLMNRVDEIRGNAKGTTYPEISKGRFREMDIVVPSKLLVEDFGKIVGDIVQQIRCLKRATLQLTQARDLLLPRLMNGEVAV